MSIVSPGSKNVSMWSNSSFGNAWFANAVCGVAASPGAIWLYSRAEPKPGRLRSPKSTSLPSLSMNFVPDAFIS